jgi:NAD-dependent DNA ligase
VISRGDGVFGEDVTLAALKFISPKELPRTIPIDQLDTTIFDINKSNQIEVIEKNEFRKLQSFLNNIFFFLYNYR